MTTSESAPDPSAATTRAIALSQTPGAPDPSAATIRSITSEARAHVALVNTQLDVIKARIDGVEREADAKRDGLHAMVTQRLAGMDKANDLLAADLRKVPTDLQIAISSVKELEGVKFSGIDSKFADNERQTGREKAAADLALAAAFDAQKEAAAATNNANAEAIRKSELATAETIKTNAETQRAGQKSLSDKIDDTKDRMNRLESLIIAIQTERSTGRDNKSDSRGALNLVAVVVSTLVGLVVVGLALYSALKP